MTSRQQRGVKEKDKFITVAEATDTVCKVTNQEIAVLQNCRQSDATDADSSSSCSRIAAGIIRKIEKRKFKKLSLRRRTG